MSIVITAASGRLGRLAVLAVLDRGVDAADVVAGARDLTKIADLAERGVRTAVIDYDDPATVEKAVSQGDTLVLVSGSDLANRDRQHAEVIAAATKTGAARIVYTSGLKADDTALPIAAMHLPTEEGVRAGGVPVTILRNGWYSENYARDIPTVRETGVLLSSTGQGAVASVSRQDLAEAIAAVVTTDGHENKTYELSGDIAWTYDELAAALSEGGGPSQCLRRRAPRHPGRRRGSRAVCGDGRRRRRRLGRRSHGLPQRRPVPARRPPHHPADRDPAHPRLTPLSPFRAARTGVRAPRNLMARLCAQSVGSLVGAVPLGRPGSGKVQSTSDFRCRGLHR
jgi:NAD(P)H dehydrogenase (quinone)